MEPQEKQCCTVCFNKHNFLLFYLIALLARKIYFFAQFSLGSGATGLRNESPRLAVQFVANVAFTFCVSSHHFKAKAEWLVRMFRRAEPNLFAQRHFKLISVYSSPWPFYAFHLLKPKFLGANWSKSSNFWTNSTKFPRSVKLQTFGRRELFFGELIAVKISVLDN